MLTWPRSATCSARAPASSARHRHDDVDGRAPGQRTTRARQRRLPRGELLEQQGGTARQEHLGRRRHAGAARLPARQLGGGAARVQAVGLAQQLARAFGGLDRPHQQHVAGRVLVHGDHYRGHPPRAAKRLRGRLPGRLQMVSVETKLPLMKRHFSVPRVEGQASRQAHADLPAGTYEREVGKEGFFGPATHLYHRHPPTAWSGFEGPLRPRAFDCAALAVVAALALAGHRAAAQRGGARALLAPRRADARPRPQCRRRRPAVRPRGRRAAVLRLRSPRDRCRRLSRDPARLDVAHRTEHADRRAADRGHRLELPAARPGPARPARDLRPRDARDARASTRPFSPSSSRIANGVSRSSAATRCR